MLMGLTRQSGGFVVRPDRRIPPSTGFSSIMQTFGATEQTCGANPAWLATHRQPPAMALPPRKKPAIQAVSFVLHQGAIGFGPVPSGRGLAGFIDRRGKTNCVYADNAVLLHTGTQCVIFRVPVYFCVRRLSHAAQQISEKGVP